MPQLRTAGIACLLTIGYLSSGAAQPADLPLKVCSVSSNGSASGSGRNWSNPMTLQAALAETACAQIWVKQGVYKPVAPTDKNSPTSAEIGKSFTINRPVEIYGGFKGTEAVFSQRPAPVNSETTVLSGDIGDDDMVDASGITRKAMDWADGYYEDMDCTSKCSFRDFFSIDKGGLRGKNSKHVVLIQGLGNYAPTNENTVIDGLTITGGRATNDGSRTTSSGGGLLCRKSGQASQCSPTLRNISALGNFSSFGGAALHFDAMEGGTAAPLIEGAYISGNYSNSGTAVDVDVYLGTSGAVIRNTTFYANAGGQTGGFSGAGSGSKGNSTIDNSTFFKNHSGGWATDIESNGSGNGLQMLITNTVIWGGYVYIETRRPRKEASAFFLSRDNFGSSQFPPVGTATITTKNSLLHQYSEWSGIYLYENNIPPANPLLDSVMPAFNGGGARTLLPPNNSLLLEAVACTDTSVDQRSMPRPQGVRCDVGAVEVQAHVLTINITGQGLVKIAPASDQPLGTPTSNDLSCENTSASCHLGFASGANVAMSTSTTNGWHLLSSDCDSSGTLTSNRVCNYIFYNTVEINQIAAQTGTVGTALNLPTPSVTQSTGPLNWQGSVPAGLIVDPNTGQVSGTPTQAGNHTITLTATDANNITGSSSYALIVQPATVTLTLPAQTLVSRSFTSNLNFPIAPLASSTSADEPATTVTYVSDTPSVCSIDVTQVLAHKAGVCSFHAVQTASANYKAAQSDMVSITITSGSQAVVFGVQDPVSQPFVPNGTFNLNPLASSSTAAVERPIRYSSTTTAVCSISGEQISMHQPGTCTIRAEQAGDANFLAAQAQEQSIEITPQKHFTGVTVPAIGQGDVASASFIGGGGLCSFDMDATRFEAAPSKQPANQGMPQGVLSFKLVHCEPGSKVRMSVTWPKPVIGYGKYGKATSTDTENSHYSLTEQHDLAITSDGLTVSYTLTDGALGDDDWSTNGEIVDPAGPVLVLETQPVPTLGVWSLMLLSALATLLLLIPQGNKQRLRIAK